MQRLSVGQSSIAWEGDAVGVKNINNNSQKQFTGRKIPAKIYLQI